MSGRDRERERDRRSTAAASARTNEYFVPKDGIDREVITADICRYLGNDALVRPGNYENPTTRQIQQGYFITAYRNLTTAMIADLKADSDRWEAERRQNAASRGATNVEYRASTTHQSRQYYGPTEASSIPSQGYAPSPASSSTPSYDQGYTSSGYGQPVAAGYATASPGYAPQDGYYVHGSNMGVSNAMDVDSTRARAPNSREVPRQPQQYASNPGYTQRDNSSSSYYQQAGPSSSVASSQYAPPTDPYYGRGTYDSQDTYDTRYQESSAYNTQPPMSSGTPTVSANSTRRRETERDDRERRHRHR